ncbi:MAG: hypothetical protein NTX44_14910 [Ignavibacteriales bacterium]|nr:hypothetical protein [Ignavibacteriales bacterium]
MHILSEILARIDEELRGSLIDDKPASVISDTSKIKRFVQGFTAVVHFTMVYEELLNGLNQILREESNDRMYKIVKPYEKALNLYKL